MQVNLIYPSSGIVIFLKDFIMTLQNRKTIFFSNRIQFNLSINPTSNLMLLATRITMQNKKQKNKQKNDSECLAFEKRVRINVGKKQEKKVIIS